MTKDECEIETSKAIMEMRSRIEELEKENAELRRDKEDLIFVRDQKAKCMCEDKQRLTKAKEIIRQLCLMVRELNNPNVQLTDVDYSLSEAEQFLKEVESTDIREDSTLDGDWIVDEH